MRGAGPPLEEAFRGAAGAAVPEQEGRTEEDGPAHDEQGAHAVGHGHARVVEQAEADVVQAGRRHEDGEPRLRDPALAVLLQRAVVHHRGVHPGGAEDVPRRRVGEDDGAHDVERLILVRKLLEEVLVEAVVAEPALDLGGGEVGAVGDEAPAQLVDVVDERAELLAEQVHAPEPRDARDEGDAAEGHGEPEDDLGAAGDVADVVGHERAARHRGDGGEPGVEVREVVQDGDPHATEHREENKPAEVDCSTDKSVTQTGGIGPSGCRHVETSSGDDQIRPRSRWRERMRHAPRKKFFSVKSLTMNC